MAGRLGRSYGHRVAGPPVARYDLTRVGSAVLIAAQVIEN